MALVSKRDLAIIGRILIGLYFITTAVEQHAGVIWNYRIVVRYLSRAIYISFLQDMEDFALWICWLLVLCKLVGGGVILLEAFLPALHMLLFCEVASTPLLFNFSDYWHHTNRSMALIGGLLLLIALEMPEENPA